VGRTLQHQVEPGTFYRPEEIRRQVVARIEALRNRGEAIDYLSFVPDGEPTLDKNLGETIERLRPLGVKIAVISNSSLLWRSEVRQALKKADWVSVKVDAIDERCWRRINRPHSDLRIEWVLGGIKLFAEEYSGVLATETMLVKGFNDNKEIITGVRDFVSSIHPVKAYLAVPTRPPAQKTIRPPGEDVITHAYHLFKEKIPEVECLIEYEGDDFSFTGNMAQDIINIAAVHPIREEALNRMLQKTGTDRSVVDELVGEGILAITEYQGRRFYLRRLKRQ